MKRLLFLFGFAVLARAQYSPPYAVGGTCSVLAGDVTGTCAASVLSNIPTATPAPGTILHTAITAPGTPGAGKGSVYVDSTSKNIAVKDDAGVVKHGVQTDTGAASNYISAISDAGLITKSRPACATLSDSGTGCAATLAAVATSGSASDLGTGTLPAARLPNPSSSTLGGTQSLAVVTSKWINTISTSGVPAATQPACSDLSNASPACSQTILSDSQTFTSSGTFTVPLWVSQVWVQAWGGGAGGAGGATINGGAGGAGGGYVQRNCAVTAGAAVTVTIGAAGSLGAATAVGGAGGDTSFGSCATALGAAAQATTASASPGGRDGAITSAYAVLYQKAAIAADSAAVQCTTGTAGVPVRMDVGGCATASPAIDQVGSLGGKAFYGGAGGASGAFGVETTRVGGTGGLSSYGGAGGNGASVTNGTPNADCSAGVQPGGGGGGGAGSAGSQSAGCAGAKGQVVVWW